MTLVETVTVGSGGAASIEFTGIPQDGKDLQVLVSARNTSTSTIFRFTLNNDTASNYTPLFLRGNGSTASSSVFAPLNNPFALEQTIDSYTANTFANGNLYVSNYASSVSKSISGDSVSENNATAAFQLLNTTQYSGTSPITSMQLFQTSGLFAEHSTASLYSIS